MNVERLWRIPAHRESIAIKIEKTIHTSNILTLKNGMEMEEHIYEKSRDKEEYFMFISRLINIIRRCGNRLDGELAGPSYADIEQPLVDPLSELPDLVARGPCEGEKWRQFQLASELMLEPAMRSGSMLTPGGRSEQSEKYEGEYSWRTPAFRKSVIAKFDEATIMYARPSSKNVMQLEQILFEKAKTREEYTNYVGRVLMYIQEMGRRLPFLPFHSQSSYSQFFSCMPQKTIFGGG